MQIQYTHIARLPSELQLRIAQEADHLVLIDCWRVEHKFRNCKTLNTAIDHDLAYHDDERHWSVHYVVEPQKEEVVHFKRRFAQHWALLQAIGTICPKAPQPCPYPTWDCEALVLDPPEAFPQTCKSSLHYAIEHNIPYHYTQAYLTQDNFH